MTVKSAKARVSQRERMVLMQAKRVIDSWCQLRGPIDKVDDSYPEMSSVLQDLTTALGLYTKDFPNITTPWRGYKELKVD